MYISNTIIDKISWYKKKWRNKKKEINFVEDHDNDSSRRQEEANIVERNSSTSGDKNFLDILS